MTIKELEKLNLNTKQALDKVKVHANELIIYTEAKQALDLADWLEKSLNIKLGAENISEADQDYINLIVQLKYTALPLLTDMEKNMLFSAHILEAIDNEELDVVERLTTSLLMISYDYRDVIKRNLRRIINTNKQLITNKKIDLTDNEVEPTIKNWLKLYDREIGAAVADNLKRAQFYTTNKNVKNLSKQEKEKIEKLFYIYEYLKSVSSHPLGVEEPILFIENGQIKSMEDGRIVVIDLDKGTVKEEVDVKKEILQKKSEVTKVEEAKEKPQVPKLSDEVKKAYIGDKKFQIDISKEEEDLSRRAGNDINILREEFFKAVQLRNRARTIAAFKALAKLKDIDNFLAEDERLKKFLTSTWTIPPAPV